MASTRHLTPYHNWTREQLITRLHQLDTGYIPEAISESSSQKPFSFSTHPKRKIALKFSYVGSDYNGLAFQKDMTPLPTVEGVLYDALVKTRLIDPEGGFEGCEWEKCGRTDRGVSAAGQVISLWVRSAIRTPEWEALQKAEAEAKLVVESVATKQETYGDDSSLMTNIEPSFSSSCVQLLKPNNLELPYIQTLNGVLPPTIRVHAWSPVSSTFSARFSCKYRHYKYFFPSTPDLNIKHMQDAAERLIGWHDFRNLCTIDGSKQIENFTRHIFRASISQVGPDESGMDIGAMHVFDLVGNGFLYNQVRSIMSILFLIGTGLEEPSVISSLMNTDPANPLPPYRPGEPIEVVDRKPEYQMADGLPLVLWDCGYTDEDVQWQIDEGPTERGGNISTNVRHELLCHYTRARIRATLEGHFLAATAQHHLIPQNPFPVISEAERTSLLKSHKGVLWVPLGGGTHTRTSKYKPLLTRDRKDGPDIVNERWRQGRGKRKLEERQTRQAKVEMTRTDDADE